MLQQKLPGALTTRLLAFEIRAPSTLGAPSSSPSSGSVLVHYNVPNIVLSRKSLQMVRAPFSSLRPPSLDLGLFARPPLFPILFPLLIFSPSNITHAIIFIFG